MNTDSVQIVDFSKPLASFEDAVNEVVALMTMQSPAPSATMPVEVPITYFNGAELFAERYMKWFRNEETAFLPDATPDLVPNVDVSIINNFTEKEVGDLYAVRIRRVDRKEVRGKVFQFFKRYVFELCLGNITFNGRFASARNYFTSDDAVNWTAIGNTCRLKRIQPAPSDLQKQLWISSSIALTQHYEWRVTLGYQGCMSIGIPTTPAGCREVFKLRDIPEGKKRRDALKHFVTEHTRRRKGIDDDEARIVVREHLRGVNQFNWNGLCCTIHPAPADLIRLGLVK